MNWFLISIPCRVEPQLLVDGAVYEPPANNKQGEVLNGVAITLAALCLLPRFLWGWNVEETLEFAGPAVGGWVFFDVALMLAFVVKIKAM